MAGVLRGVRQRAGVSLGILLIATVAAAAATVGPLYDAAARTSILRDATDAPAVIDRAVEATSSGPVTGLAASLTTEASAVLAAHLGRPAQLRRLFQPPVADLLAQVQADGHPEALTWHTGECAHLRLISGTCPTAPRQVLVSPSYAAQYHLTGGATIATTSPWYGTLTVTGVYAIPSLGQLNDAYWLDGPCADFGAEDTCPIAGSSAQDRKLWDALFTSAATFTGAPLAEQGQAAVWDVLSPDGVQASDLGPLTAAVNEFLTDPGLAGANVSTISSIPQLTGQVTSDWGSLDVPVFLITGQLLLLAWLLLFLIAIDAAEARAAEVALAKLRGHGRLRTVAFGLSEPAALLAAAFPAGALAGWAITAGLTRILLRPGTPTAWQPLAIAAAALATLGGFVAVVIAGRRALTRPITEQWQRASGRATARGWVLDAVLLTGALAGLAELFADGNVTSARSGSLSLLVPGLAGLAAAVVASRLLPAACRLAFAATRRHAGIALFLAVRHIARRPGGTRTTIALAAAFTLATFAVTGYAVAQRNIERVATAQTGASVVLSVQAPQGQDLGAIVDRIDPGGTEAAAVDRYAGGSSNGSVLLAVQPQRFARVARWLPGFFGKPPGWLGSALTPPVPAPVTLPAAATALRVQVSGLSGVQRGSVLTFWLTELGAQGGGQTPQSLGTLRDGWLQATLSGCPCQVAMMSVDSPPTATVGPETGGSLTLSGLSARTGVAKVWTSVPGALADPAAGWNTGTEASGCSSGTGRVAATGPGMRWSFRVTGGCSPALLRHDIPGAVPALVAGQLTGTLQPMSATGLDGQSLTVRPVALAAAVPGAPGTGIVVDRTFAQRAADFVSTGLVSEQVWTTTGALAAIRSRLAAAGVTIDGTATISGAETALDRQGPALASVLFLTAAWAAAVLATGAAVLGLYQAGRRRRHEYAALIAGRVTRRSLRASVVIEQATVLGFGVAAGIATGLASAVLVLRKVPEFSSPPVSPPLLFSPPAGPVLIPLAVTVALVSAVAVLAAVALIASVRTELLREAAP